MQRAAGSDEVRLLSRARTNCSSSWFTFSSVLDRLSSMVSFKHRFCPVNVAVVVVWRVYRCAAAVEMAVDIGVKLFDSVPWLAVVPPRRLGRLFSALRTTHGLPCSAAAVFLNNVRRKHFNQMDRSESEWTGAGGRMCGVFLPSGTMRPYSGWLDPIIDLESLPAWSNFSVSQVPRI